MTKKLLVYNMPEDVLGILNKYQDKYEFETIEATKTHLNQKVGHILEDNIDENKENPELEHIDINFLMLHNFTNEELDGFLKDMKEADSGIILNVASIAGFLPGPLMAAYYSSKSYVLRLSQSIREELKKQKSNVKISVLCPGPVNTNFNNVAGVKFGLPAFTSEHVAKYTIKKMLKNKFLIIPGLTIKLTAIASKIIPSVILSKFVYISQKRKEER